MQNSKLANNIKRLFFFYPSLKKIIQAEYEDGFFLLTVVECKVVRSSSTFTYFPFQCLFSALLALAGFLSLLFSTCTVFVKNIFTRQIFCPASFVLVGFVSPWLHAGPPKDGFSGRKWRVCQSLSFSSARCQPSKPFESMGIFDTLWLFLQLLKTKVVEWSVNPVFNETFRFQVFL